MQNPTTERTSCERMTWCEPRMGHFVQNPMPNGSAIKTPPKQPLRKQSSNQRISLMPGRRYVDNCETTVRLTHSVQRSTKLTNVALVPDYPGRKFTGTWLR